MEETDEAEACANLFHLLARIRPLQSCYHLAELSRFGRIRRFNFWLINLLIEESESASSSKYHIFREKRTMLSSAPLLAGSCFAMMISKPFQIFSLSFR